MKFNITRGFIASIRAFNLLTRGFELELLDLNS